MRDLVLQIMRETRKQCSREEFQELLDEFETMLDEVEE